MAFDTAAGATIAFSASAPASYDSTGYAALTYSAGAEVTGFGEFGREYNLVTHTPLSSRAAKKAKGSYNNGSLSVDAAFDAGDAGQGVLETAETSDDPISVKVTYDSGEVFYFEALVMSLKRGGNTGTDEVQTITAQLEITHNPIVEVAA